MDFLYSAKPCAYLIVYIPGRRPFPSCSPTPCYIKMPVEITRMVESDIDGAVECIQKAFAEDPYFEWVFPENVRIYTSIFNYS